MKYVSTVIAAALLASAPARAQVELEGSGAASIEWLKATYLACDRAMSSGRVEAAFAQRCSAVADVLKDRAFDGDFDRMLQWWRTERRAMPPDGDRHAKS
jgi:hypothetical protein